MHAEFHKMEPLDVLQAHFKVTRQLPRQSMLNGMYSSGLEVTMAKYYSGIETSVVVLEMR